MEDEKAVAVIGCGLLAALGFGVWFMPLPVWGRILLSIYAMLWVAVVIFLYRAAFKGDSK